VSTTEPSGAFEQRRAMSDMVGKVSVQAKIAELESRISALERGAPNYHRDTVTRTTAVTIKGKPFGEHWNKMWDEFNAMMKEMFE
jgi:hypothetical protein